MADRAIPDNLVLKIGIAGALGLGAVATGMFVSRRGRNLMKDAWRGRRRTTLEDRVLDRLWGDRVFARRELDVEEIRKGMIVVSGDVRSLGERRRALRLAAAARGVEAVIDRIGIDPRLRDRPGTVHLPDRLFRTAGERTDREGAR